MNNQEGNRKRRREEGIIKSISRIILKERAFQKGKKGKKEKKKERKGKRDAVACLSAYQSRIMPIHASNNHLLPWVLSSEPYRVCMYLFFFLFLFFTNPLHVFPESRSNQTHPLHEPQHRHRHSAPDAHVDHPRYRTRCQYHYYHEQR